MAQQAHWAFASSPQSGGTKPETQVLGLHDPGWPQRFPSQLPRHSKMPHALLFTDANCIFDTQ
jgi:hypothetical protein